MLGALLESLLLDAAELGPLPILRLVWSGSSSDSGCGGSILLLTIRTRLEGIFLRFPC